MKELTFAAAAYEYKDGQNMLKIRKNLEQCRQQYAHPIVTRSDEGCWNLEISENLTEISHP